MLLALTLPRIQPYMATAVIRRIYAVEGQPLEVGSKLFDLRVDIGAAAPHDCPPVSHYRFAMRERVWLRRLAVTEQDEVPLGAKLAEFSTTVEEPLAEQSVRAVRIAIAGILVTGY